MEKFAKWREQQMAEGFGGGEKSDVEIMAKAMIRVIKDKCAENNVDPKEVVREIASKIGVRA